MVGKALAHYRILEQLGAGGMGVVYRAQDTRLGREVAIKVLPEAFAKNPDRMARFEREAQVLASLNHPNIATIHGLEEGQGVRALVMELVEGPTLADRIERGPMPLEEALPIARQIAEALEYAHEKGILHRDLKPANVKVTPQGAVKVLDFGLAKALEDSPAGEDISTSPTLSVAATKAGVMLGTAAYMSPEQAHGRTADRRADIWSFGVVLYEMLAGKQAFTGESVSDTLASVLKFHPDWEALPAGTPEAIRKLLRRCLAKDRRQRLQAIGEARIAIEEYLASPSAASAAPVILQSKTQNPKWGWIAAGMLAVTLGAVLAGWWRSTRPVSPPLIRLDVDLGPDALAMAGAGVKLALSPDGTRVVSQGRSADGKQRLYTRLLDQPQPVPLAGTENPDNPFFSPDGQWIGFFADGKLKKISVQGGAAVTLCDAPNDRGGSWGEDGNIIAALDIRSGLSQAPSAGGTPRPVTQLRRDQGELTHRWPQVLPGAQAVLFTMGARAANFDEAQVEVQLLKTGRRKTLQRGASYGRYLPTDPAGGGRGHLVYMHQGTLFAAPMDLDRLELTGPAAPVLEGVMTVTASGLGQFAFSQTGTFAFLKGGATLGNWLVVWMDSAGRTQPLRATPGQYYSLRLSPDGKRLAMTVTEGGNSDIWVYEWARDTMSRLTFIPGFNGPPVWTPDGKHLAFASVRGGSAENIYWMRADGAGDVQRLTESKNRQLPYSFSPDGRRLAFVEFGSQGTSEIWTLPLDQSDSGHPKPGKPELFLRTQFNENFPAFSPDGRWLAYVSAESGPSQVYVRPFPGPGGKWQISTGGGSFPLWSRNGRELFYRTQDNHVMVASYTAKGDAFQADKARLWSEKQFRTLGPFSNFDLAPDGKRFAMVMDPGQAGEQQPLTHATFLLNFFDELRRRVPAGK